MREHAAGCLAEAVRRELSELGMAGVDFCVNVSRTESAEGIAYPDGKRYAVTADGADDIEFMAATNPGEPLRPLAKIASTGEMSRFTLALKGALSEADRTPVLVFDEIELGIGGRTGDVIGQKLWRLARQRQVICVTHLPQIAAFADAHFRVRKQISGERSTSQLEALDAPSRTSEIAEMLAGSERSEAAAGNARELLDKAHTWKSRSGLSA
jgi:DNA repair protein RecN (Recombination protein N)